MISREQVNGVIRRLRDLGREGDAEIVEKLADDCLPKPMVAADIYPEEVIASSIIRKARSILGLHPTVSFIEGMDQTRQLLDQWCVIGAVLLKTGEISRSDVQSLIEQSNRNGEGI